MWLSDESSTIPTHAAPFVCACYLPFCVCFPSSSAVLKFFIISFTNSSSWLFIVIVNDVPYSWLFWRKKRKRKRKRNYRLLLFQSLQSLVVGLGSFELWPEADGSRLPKCRPNSALSRGTHSDKFVPYLILLLGLLDKSSNLLLLLFLLQLLFLRFLISSQLILHFFLSVQCESL